MLTFYPTVSCGELGKYAHNVPCMLLPVSSWAAYKLRQQGKQGLTTEKVVGAIPVPTIPRGVQQLADDCGGFVATKKWGMVQIFDRCAIMETNEAAWQVLPTPTRPRLLNLCRRFLAMSELYHATQLPLFSSSDELQEKVCTKCGKPRLIERFNFRDKGKYRTSHCNDCRAKAKRDRYVKKPSVIERFWQKTDRTGECWLWTGYCKRGYGLVRWQKKEFIASRVAWQLTYGDIPKDMCVCHKCDNPRCIRPDHLFLGTKGVNNQDRASKGKGYHPPCGALSPLAKLTYEEVTSIRSAYQNGTSKASLARQYTVSPRTIKLIVEHKTWRQE